MKLKISLAKCQPYYSDFNLLNIAPKTNQINFHPPKMKVLGFGKFAAWDSWESFDDMHIFQKKNRHALWD